MFEEYATWDAIWGLHEGFMMKPIVIYITQTEFTYYFYRMDLCRDKTSMWYTFIDL